MGGARPGRAGWVGPAVIAAVAVVVTGIGLWAVWLTPAEGIRIVGPALEAAEGDAARTGDPVVRWEVDDEGVPDADTPLLAALATLPEDVTVAVRRLPRAAEGSWSRGALLEVGREGHLDRACLRLQRPPTGVVRWQLRGYRVPLRWPVGGGCATVARGAPAEVLVRGGEVTVPSAVVTGAESTAETDRALEVGS